MIAKAIWKSNPIRVEIIQLIDQIRAQGSEVDRQAWNPEFDEIHRQFVEHTGYEVTYQELWWNMCLVRKNLERIRRKVTNN